jgi:aminotransferase in exopolysaccharide biosynthesis
MDQKAQKLIEFIKSLYPGANPVQLHAPVFRGNEKKYLLDCIDSTFVSYVGPYVTKFEEMTARFTGARYAIAVVNGTAALQVALQIAGVKPGDEVITQALTFAATASAIVHAGAEPVFVDVDQDTMGMSPERLEDWLVKNTDSPAPAERPIDKMTGRPVSAVVPMHTFGHPCHIDEIKMITEKYHIILIEDSAESLGSYYKGKHTGTFGLAGILSYNGNKTITTGGGGMIITNDEKFAARARHITTTAKVPHRWEYVHDEAGYNYRMTNVNAAIGVAQMEKITEYLQNKRETAREYEQFCSKHGIGFMTEPKAAVSNYWLNAIILEDRNERDAFLEFSNDQGVMTRPIWRLMNKLDVYKRCRRDDLVNSQWLEDRIVNIPSGVRA